MAIFRAHKKKSPFVILDKTVINDVRLSARAKGLHTYLMSLPDSWDVVVSKLIDHFTDGKKSIYGAIRELKKYGYVTYESGRTNDGVFSGGIYHVYERPEMNVTDSEKHDVTEDDSPQTLSRHADLRHSGYRRAVKEPLVNNKNNKYKNKINNKAAAINNNDDRHKPAAGFCEDKTINPYLGKQLTADQKRYVAYRVQHGLLAQAQIALPKLPVNLLMHDIEQCLVNPKRFTKTGHDFFFKFNAIAKAIMDGKWKPSGIDGMHAQLQALKRDAAGIQQTIARLEANSADLSADAYNSYQNELDKKYEGIAYLEQQLGLMSDGVVA